MSDTLSVADFISDVAVPMQLYREVNEVYPSETQSPGLKNGAQELLLDEVREYQAVTMAQLASELGGEGSRKLLPEDIPHLAAALVIDQYLGTSMFINPVRTSTIQNLSNSLPHDALSSRPTKSAEETEQDLRTGLHVIVAQGESRSPEIAMLKGKMAHVKGPANIRITRMESRHKEVHKVPLSVELTHDLGVTGEVKEIRYAKVPVISPRLVLSTDTIGLGAVTEYRNVSPLVKKAALGVAEQVEEGRHIQPTGLYGLIFALNSGLLTPRKFRGLPIKMTEQKLNDRNMKSLIEAGRTAGLTIQS